jgi:hypothetical protein
MLIYLPVHRFGMSALMLACRIKSVKVVHILLRGLASCYQKSSPLHGEIYVRICMEIYLYAECVYLDVYVCVWKLFIYCCVDWRLLPGKQPFTWYIYIYIYICVCVYVHILCGMFMLICMCVSVKVVHILLCGLASCYQKSSPLHGIYIYIYTFMCMDVYLSLCKMCLFRCICVSFKIVYILLRGFICTEFVSLDVNM